MARDKSVFLFERQINLAYPVGKKSIELKRYSRPGFDAHSTSGLFVLVSFTEAIHLYKKKMIIILEYTYGGSTAGKLHTYLTALQESYTHILLD